MKFGNYNELLSEVKASGGVLTIGMAALRNLQGAGKLGSRVIEEIEAELEKRGLRHLPEQLPTSQDDSVRVFVSGGQIGKLIEAAHEVGFAADEILRAYADAAGERLRQRIDDVSRLADEVLGPRDPKFNMKQFSDNLCGEPD